MGGKPGALRTDLLGHRERKAVKNINSISPWMGSDVTRLVLPTSGPTSRFFPPGFFSSFFKRARSRSRIKTFVFPTCIVPHRCKGSRRVADTTVAHLRTMPCPPLLPQQVLFLGFSPPGFLQEDTLKTYGEAEINALFSPRVLFPTKVLAGSSTVPPLAGTSRFSFSSRTRSRPTGKPR